MDTYVTYAYQISETPHGRSAGKEYPKVEPIPGQEPVHIDFSLIPESVIEEGCAVLASSIRRALRDPEKRKECERWKAERAARDAEK